MSTQFPPEDIPPLQSDAIIGIVAAQFNPQLVHALLTGCRLRLLKLGASENQIMIHRVPGAFELPLAAKWLAERKGISAVICLGAVVRGDTPHFDYVAGECARGIQAVALATNVPIIFGVLTTNTEQQAFDRLGGPHGHAGQRAADAAAEMIHLRARLNNS